MAKPESKGQYTDKEILINQAYKNPSLIGAREYLYSFVEGTHFNVQAEVLNTLETYGLTGAEKFIDIGCGRAQLSKLLAEKYPDLKITDLDFSTGMFAQTREDMLLKPATYGNIFFKQGSCEQLPFADNSFDFATALHTLYHAQNIETAILEATRILRPDGLYVVTANSIYGRPEMRKYKEYLKINFGITEEDQTERFNVEMGAQILPQYFKEVNLTTYTSMVTLRDQAGIDAYVGYFNSRRPTYSRVDGNPHIDDKHWIKAMNWIGQAVGYEIGKKGEFTEPHTFGILVGKGKR